MTRKLLAGLMVLSPLPPHQVGRHPQLQSHAQPREAERASEKGSPKATVPKFNGKCSFAYAYDVTVRYWVNLLKGCGRCHVGASNESLRPDFVQETSRRLHRHQVPSFQLVPVQPKAMNSEASFVEKGDFISVPKLSKMFCKYAKLTTLKSYSAKDFPSISSAHQLFYYLHYHLGNCQYKIIWKNPTDCLLIFGLKLRSNWNYFKVLINEVTLNTYFFGDNFRHCY